MKLTKLFAIIISTCTLLSLSGMAGKSATSWRKDIARPAVSYDERGYKGSDEKIFIAIYAEGELLDIAIKLVPTSYQELMDEIWYTLEHAHPYIKNYISQHKWGRENLQLWNRTVSRQQMDLKGITVGSRWILSDKFDQENQKEMHKLSALYRAETENPADYDANGYKGPGNYIIIVLDSGAPMKVKLVSTSLHDLMEEIWRTLEHNPAMKKDMTEKKWALNNLTLWPKALTHQQMDFKGITPGSEWYVIDKLDAEFASLVASTKG